MQVKTKSAFQGRWVKILAKGMITIPKDLREEVGIKEEFVKEHWPKEEQEKE